jgi:chromosome segregation ATPase
MMKGKGTAGWMVVVSGLLLVGGCTGTGGDKADLNSQVQQLKTALDATKNERDLLEQDATKLKQELDKTDSALASATQTNTKLQSQFQDLTKSRDDLSARVEELTAARTDLQKRVEELTTSCGTLEKQVEGLTKARDAARADAASAQAKIDQLTEKLKGQTQQMVELQDQMASVRTVLQQLQQKLE